MILKIWRGQMGNCPVAHTLVSGLPYTATKSKKHAVERIVQLVANDRRPFSMMDYKNIGVFSLTPFKIDAVRVLRIYVGV